MKIKLLKWYQYIVIFVLLSVAFFIYSYLGIPFDVFKETSTIDIVSSGEVEVSGLSIQGNKCIVESEQNSIIIEGDEYRTIVIDINSMSSEEVSCIVYFTESDGVFTDRYHKQYVLEEDENRLVIPYRKDFSKVRIDFKTAAGTEINFNSFYAVNRYSRLWMDLETIVILYIIVISGIVFLINLKQQASKFKDINEKIYDILFEPFKKVVNDLSDFISKNRITVFWLGMIALIAFGAQMFNYTLSIDEENSTMNPNDYIHIISCGRYSLALLLKVFGNSPYINTIFATIFIFASAIILLMVLRPYKDNETKVLPGVISGSLFMTMPYVIGQSFNFSTFGLWIALGYLLCFLAVLLFSYTQCTKVKNKWTYYIYSIVLLTFAFGIYQSFLPVYVYLIVCIVYILIKNVDKKEDIKKVFIYILKSVLVFAIACIFYKIIDTICQNIFVSTSGYLESVFVGWNKTEPNSWVLYNVWENWSKLLDGSYFNLTAGEVVKYTVIAFLIYSFINVSVGNKINRLLVFIYSPFMIIVPFIIPLALGTFIMLGRSLEAFPMMLGIIWYLILSDAKEFKLIYKFVGVFAIGLVILQLQHYNEFVYADHLRYQLDTEMASDIMLEIEKIDGNEGKAICFVGTYRHDNQNSLEYISGCESFFNFGTGDNTRILNFLNLSGYTVVYPSEEQLQAARTVSPSLPVWPKDGSISDQGDYIIVNLSH